MTKIPPDSMRSRNVWFDPKGAADYLNTCTSTLAKKRLRGDGPAYVKFGRLVRYSQVWLDEYMDCRRRTSTSLDAGLTSPVSSRSDAPIAKTEDDEDKESPDAVPR